MIPGRAPRPVARLAELMNCRTSRLGRAGERPNSGGMIPSVPLFAVTAATWFGPAQASFTAPVEGSAYDFRSNDVRVVFTAADGRREERLAYYDGGSWRAWLAAERPGSYRAELVRNGAPAGLPAQEVVLPESARLTDGFVRVAGERFVLDSGRPFFPLGHNLGWHYPDQPGIPEQLRAMGAARMNWSRVWACAWDGKNPFFVRGQPYPSAGEMMPEVFSRWDAILAAAEAAGVRIQLVLFHHGLVSTRNDSNWAEHPWNRANGGFLDRPQQFFTDATAKEYQKRWLRHAVARWGHSPAVMPWELFNEVEWVDTAQIDRDWPTIVGWHAEMAAFIRELDPYRHLVTTSAAREHPELYRAMDFYQPHTYPRNVFVGIAGVRPHPGKPWFFGEFGRGTWEHNADEHLTVRDGLWASLLSGHAGAAQYWFWERVVQQRLEPEFTRAARALERARLPERREARPVAVEVRGAARAPLAVSPGQGWGRTERFRFELPGDATPEKLVEWAAFLNAHNGVNAASTREPLEFGFTAPAPGEVEIVFTSLSGKGAGLRVWLDGAVVSQVAWPAAAQAVVAPTGGHAHQPAPASLRIPVAAGRRVLRLESTGPDWVQLERVVFPGIGEAVRAHAIASEDFALVRLTADPAALGTTVDLRVAGLRDGAQRVWQLDLETGAETEMQVELVGGTLRGFALGAVDQALVFSR